LKLTTCFDCTVETQLFGADSDVDCLALFDELGLLVFVHGAMWITFAALEQPQSIRAVGLHQTTGDCNATTDVHTPLGQVCLLL